MPTDLAAKFIPQPVREFRARESGGYRTRMQRMAKDLHDVIAMNSGDPDLTAAPVVVEAAVEALRSGKTRYAHGGLPELRTAIAKKLAADNGVSVDPETQVIITNGSAEAATALFLTLLDPGDEVLTTDPYYSGHVSAIQAARGTPVLVPTRGEDLWEPDPAEVERRVTPRTKAFIFANPGNPSAAVYRRETLQALLDLAERRNILMIPDELFERYVYDDRQHVSMASLPGGADRVVTINGFSKSYCMTGWRVGWLAAPAWLSSPLGEMRYALSMATGTANMWGAVAALSDAARPYYDEVYRTYGERRAFFFDAFTRMGLPQRPAPAAFVGMVDIRKTGRPSPEVAEAFLQEGRVWIWPGEAFGQLGAGYLRVGLIRPIEALREAVKRVSPIVQRLLTQT